MERSNNQAAKATYDPGWNDPPTLSYNGQQQTTPNRPRLNKRVAFPLTGGTPPSTASAATVMPPLSSSATMPPLPRLLPQAPEDLSEINEDVLAEVKDILFAFLDASVALGPKANDIKRRIQAMEDMWMSGKLNSRVQVYMKELAYALRDDRPSHADEIHRVLMVDHVNVVGSWMPGIKQLVHHCIARSELLAIDKETL